jgi:predicted Abi (CAAX) family protease
MITWPTVLRTCGVMETTDAHKAAKNGYTHSQTLNAKECAKQVPYLASVLGSRPEGGCVIAMDDYTVNTHELTRVAAQIAKEGDASKVCSLIC